MVNQYVLIGIIIAVFIAGLSIGSMIQQNTVSPMMNVQQMQQMMNDPKQMSMWNQQMMNNPQAMNQWMNTMVNDPQTQSQMMALMTNNPQMNNWMQDSQHVTQMTQLMRDNHDFMQEMMKQMLNDPGLRLQMIGHMSENQEAMNQMQMMFNGTNSTGKQMGHMMSP